MSKEPALVESDATDIIYLVISDIHGGNQLGLLAPGTMLWQENIGGDPTPWVPSLNPLQVELWDMFQWDLDWVVKMAAGRPIVVKLNGDITQGLKYVREWVSVRPSDQIEIAVRILKAILMMPGIRSLDLVMGTGSHEVDQTNPILAARILNAEGDVPVGLANHYISQVNDTIFDLAHHGPIPGSRRWLEGNSLRWYTNDIQQRELDLGREPPHWVVRSHYHTVGRSASDYRKGTRLYRTESLLTPGFTGMDGYARQATRSKFEIHVGMCAWQVPAKGVAGSESLEVRFKILDTRRREIIK